MPAYTQDQLAAAIIAEGQTARTFGTPETLHPVISEKGIVIALATALVESNLTEYANPADPESENFPHDAQGSDHLSDGDFQQQPPWWGTAAERMSPSLSAAMFFHTLVAEHIGTQDYNTDATTPGGWAQMVQGSAYPARYDTRMADAQAIYDRLSGGKPVVAPAPAPAADPRLAALQAAKPDFNEYGNFSNNSQDRVGTPIDLWLLHTEEGDMNADALVKWMDNNGVSYHYAGSQDPNDGGVTVVDMVDTDYASWSVMNSNDRSINFCFAGSYTSWTRDDWISKAGKVIDVAAYLAVEDTLKYSSLLAKVIAAPYSDPPGYADHNYCTAYLKDGNNHTDVGGNFPWDVFKAAVAKYWAAASSGQDPHPAPTPPPTPPDAQHQPQPEDPALETMAQVRGRWEMLGWQTMVEALAELRDKITGSSDSGKEGFEW